MFLLDRWRISLSLSLITSLVGALLLIVLALGAANPHHAGVLFWQANSDVDWQQYASGDIFAFYKASVTIPSAPFTLELTATNNGNPESAWGIWLETDQGLWLVLVNREGYSSVGDCCTDGLYSSPIKLNLDWREFLHIRPQTKLYLNVEADASATLRFNDEIAWTGNLILVPDGQWGTIYYRNPRLTWRTIKIYAQS